MNLRNMKEEEAEAEEEEGEEENRNQIIDLIREIYRCSTQLLYPQYAHEHLCQEFHFKH
jgi:hypothetical protein